IIAVKNFVDYYSILEIGFPSDELEIKRQFKKLAKIIHPDLNSSVDATSKMRLLLEAYEILSSYSKKKFYDAQYAFLILKKKNGFSVREKKSAGPIVVNAFEHEDLLVQPSIIL